jgi:hypothetical protein
MPLSPDQSSEVMRSATGLHGDDAGRQLCSEGGDAPWPHPPAFYNSTCLIQTDQAAAVFAEINPEHGDLH